MTRGEKRRARIRNKYNELDTSMAGWLVDQVVEQVVVEHNCQGSAACSTWMCCGAEYYRRMEEDLEIVRNRIEKLSLASVG